MGNFTLCEMLKSLPLESCHPILVAKQDPGSRCFQSADCFWVLPVAKMLWDEVVKKKLIHGHLGVTCLIFRHFMSLSITFCCSFCIDYTHLHFVICWHDLEMNNLHFWHQAAGKKSEDHDQLDDCETLWKYVKVPQLDPQIRLWTTSDATGSTPGFCRIRMWMAGKWFMLHCFIWKLQNCS